MSSTKLHQCFIMSSKQAYQYVEIMYWWMLRLHSNFWDVISGKSSDLREVSGKLKYT